MKLMRFVQQPQLSFRVMSNHSLPLQVAFEVGLTLNDPKLVDHNIHAATPTIRRLLGGSWSVHRLGTPELTSAW